MEFLKKPPDFSSTGMSSARGVKRDDAAHSVAKDADAEPAEGGEETRRVVEAALRGQEAAREANRILSLQCDSFDSKVDWAFALLDTGGAASSSRDPASVQRSFRGLMKKLHPDRVGYSSDLARAVEMVREAKDVALKHVSEVERPGPPRAFQAATLCAVPGQRRIRLQWLPPEDQKSAPIRRYIVRVIDPVCGRALTVAVLEPDFIEDLHRFVSVEELGSYVLAEQELHKMPGLWKQSTATVQVAAANEAGESPWTVLKLPLTTAPALPLAVPTMGLRQTSPSPSESPQFETSPRCQTRPFSHGQPVNFQVRTTAW